MKFFIENVLWIGLAIGSAVMLLLPALKRSAGGGTVVSPNEAVLLINRSNAVVLDVRDDAEFAAGHVAGAKHIPLAQLETRAKELHKLKDKPLLVYCQSGPRAAKASAQLRKLEFSKLYNLDGGLDAWVQAKLPTVKD